MYYTIKWNGDSVSLLDQRLLPFEEKYRIYNHYMGVVSAIKDMEIRGAPAIGIAAAMGIALAAQNVSNSSKALFLKDLEQAIQLFAATRPTAVNLFTTIERMRKVLTDITTQEDAAKKLEAEALAIMNEDVKANKAMGKNGSRFLSDGDTVLTHCNAGALATGGYGTALGVIRAAVEEGKNIHVFACETRPYLQGARITAWELQSDNIPVTLITDNMAGHFMKTGEIQKVIVGADRISMNGDVANKIGTYTHAVLAKTNYIPFYVAAPVSTLDPDTATGNDITIEERSADEVAYIRSEQIAPEGIFIRNPSFDVTPVEYVSAIITERCVIEDPAATGIKPALKA